MTEIIVYYGDQQLHIFKKIQLIQSSLLIIHFPKDIRNYQDVPLGQHYCDIMCHFSFNLSQSGAEWTDLYIYSKKE